MTRELKLDYDTLSTMIRNDFGSLLKQIREREDMSQGKLASLIGRRQAYISELETGKVEPSITTLFQLSYVFDKPLLYFVPQSWRDQSTQRQVNSAEELSPEDSELIRSILDAKPFVEAGLLEDIIEVFVKHAEQTQRFVEGE